MPEPSENLGFLVADTARLWRYALDLRLQPLGLSQAKWRVLLQLYREDGMIQKELAGRLGVEAPTLAVLLDRMSEDGWLMRRESNADRRRKTVHLTTKGQEVIRQIRATAAHLRRDILAEIPVKDLERCAAVLEQIKEAAVKVSLKDSR
ncbi:MAG: MarR family winged helix-turn-helix transcriptional regulator [Sulfurifustaceae bacterium]